MSLSATLASEPTPVAELTTHHTSPSPEPDDAQTEYNFEQPSPEHQPLSPRQETEVPQSQDPSHPYVPEARTMTVEDLLHLVPNLITMVVSLETELKQTKLTMGKAIVKLVKKDIDDDPLGSKRDFVTPTKPSGEAQAEAIRLQTLEEEKTAKQDAIRAKLEANVELTKNVLGKELPEDDFAKKMVELLNQRKKFFAEERAKARRRVKEEFDKLVKQVESFVPMNIEATKAQLKR
ncbi:hypothetical protein Tco_0717559 [Tanacetum coccineum]